MLPVHCHVARSATLRSAGGFDGEFLEGGVFSGGGDRGGGPDDPAEGAEALAGAGAEGQRELAWERLEPGHYQATTELQQGQWLRGAVRVGRQALPFGPVVLGNSTEWAFDERRVQELRNVARVSGGREIVDPRQAWRSPVQPRFADLSGWLLVVTLVLLLAEALVTRTGWKPPVWERRERAAVKPIGRSKAKGARGAGAREVAASIVTAGGQGNATGEAANANAAAEERERRFARAKRR